MDSSFSKHRGGDRESTPEVLPASQYLQDRLQERRARNMRPKRAKQSDFGPRRSGRDDDIFLNEVEESRNSRMFDSSPIATGSRVGSEAGTSGRRRAVGSKDMEVHMDQLAKQNFALKLELDHRRGNMTKLQEQIEDMRQQVERAEQLEEEHAELLRINTQLVEELEKRDKAVEEAMDIICELEDRVGDLEERSSNTRPSTANADSGYAGTETQEQVPPSSPQASNRIVPKTPSVSRRQAPAAASTAAAKAFDPRHGPTPARLKREPSVLTQKKPSTHALRSVYMENAQSLHPVQSFHSLLSRREQAIEDEEDVLNSPRLSVLSESSFPSLYSPKKYISPERFEWEDAADEAWEEPHNISGHSRQDSIKRVSQWMEERDGPEDTPSKSNKLSSPSKLAQQLEHDLQHSPTKRSGDDERYQSLADALSQASTAAPRTPNEIMQPASKSKQRPRPEALKKEPRPTSFAGPIFGSSGMPPTPDSVSTRMLRNSRSGIADGDRSLLDVTPAQVKGYAALQPQPSMRTAPKQMRSSIELKPAYQSYIQRNNDDAPSDSEGEDDEEVDEYGVRRANYDGFPDGNSILNGTPSRFLKNPEQHQQAANDILFNGADVSPLLQRRQSGSDATINPRKPSLSRAETSPTFLGPIATSLGSGSNGSVMSPRSFHSGSSSNRTVVTNYEQALSPTLSPTFAPARLEASPPQQRARTPAATGPSPAKTLSQRTQRLFRRMSNNTRDSPHHSGPSTITSTARDPSPLPTLTSTPSSAYLTPTAGGGRRPSSSAGQQRPSSSRTKTSTSTTGEQRRPSLQARTLTEPSPEFSRRPSIGAEGLDSVTGLGRANPFKRSQSVRTTAGSQRPGTAGRVDGGADEWGRVGAGGTGKEGSNSAKGIGRRRGSIRDAVSSAASGGRRGWR